MTTSIHNLQENLAPTGPIHQNTALSKTLQLVGDRWTLMILSTLIANIHRFNAIEYALGINRSLLSSRLDKLISAGLIEKQKYQDKPPRFEYHITAIGKELSPILTQLSRWGEKYAANVHNSKE